jgi:hypothetical protein
VIPFVIGALAAALVIALAALVAHIYSGRRTVRLALQQETRALDRAHAAELRSEQQINALLDRISTAPRIEVRPAESAPQVKLGERRYIADHQADDAAWNEYRGEPAEEAAE